MPESVLMSKNGVFPWLEALLDSSSVVIFDHYYATDIGDKDLSQWSRTGQGIMLKRQGDAWRVPPELQNNPDNNQHS